MIKHFRHILVLVLGLLVFAPVVPAQSIHVFAHTTIESGQVLSECGTTLNDAATRFNYPSVATVCQLFSDLPPSYGLFNCAPGWPTSQCDQAYRVTPGNQYAAGSVHWLNMFYYGPDMGCLVTPDFGGYAYGFADPFKYGSLSSPPEFTEIGDAAAPYPNPTSVDPGICWTSSPVLVAKTSSSIITAMQVTPSTTTLLQGDTQPFSANIPANWKLLSGPGDINATTGMYQAPESMSSDQTAFIQGCDVNNQNNCDKAKINLEHVIVTVFPGNQEVVQGETLRFSASTNPASFDPTNKVTWSVKPEKPEVAAGTIDANGVYTPPSNSQIPRDGATITITATSAKNTAVIGTANVYLAHVSAVNPVGSLPAMLADPNQSTTFTAFATGPASPHVLDWKVISPPPSTLGTITSSPPNAAVFTPAPILKEQQAQIQACMAEVCGQAPLTLVPFIRIASINSPWNSGENNAIQIKGTGFGGRPQVSFSDAAINFTPDAVQTDPDTLISGTVSVETLTLPESIVVTVTNTASPITPPPFSVTVKVNPVQVTVSLFPTSATVPVGQSATFTPTVTCKTAGGLTCPGPGPTPQTVTCSLKPQIGTVSSGAACVYTAPSVSTQQLFQVVACSALTPTACGPTCVTPTCGIATVTVPPVNVTVSPTGVTLTGGQKKQFSATVTNNPDTHVVWSIVPDPLVPADTPAGSIDQNGLYTAPNPITIQQTIKVHATSKVDSSRFGDVPVSLVPLTVSPTSVKVKVGQTQTFSAATGATNTPADWSLDPPNNPAVGSITPAGVYTAPKPLAGVTKVTVIATSKADGSMGTATVLLSQCTSKCRAVAHVSAATIGTPYSDTVKDPTVATPVGYRFTGNLPPNLSFATDTGAIVGTPVQPPAIYGFAVTPFYADGDSPTQQYALPVCQSLSALPANVGPIPINTSYSILYAPGTNPPGMFSYSIAKGELPSGMGLDVSTGTVSGTPSAAGTYTYTIHTALVPGSATPVACSPGTSTDVTYQVTIFCDACGNASLSPTSLSFPGQNVGTISAPQAITLTNNGTGSLLVAGVAASGDFAQTNNCGNSLAAKASCTVNVTFKPTVPGVRTGTLSVSDNAAGSPHTASLSGTGTAPSVSLSPTSLAFAGQNSGTTSPAQTVTLSNSGSGPLSITSIIASGDFSQTNNCGNSVAANASCIINVTFTPTAPGTRTGTLSISDNAAGSPHTVGLSGIMLQGYHNVANCQGSTGWAWDSTQPNTPINVYIFENQHLLATVLANQFRQDLVNAGIGNGYHGFNWPTLPSLLDGQPHNVTIRFSSDPNSAPLTNSPKSISCAPTPSYQGYHDVLNCQGTTGWAWDSTQSNTPINVYIFEGQRLLATVLANEFRQDLVNAGIGNGYHGFTWPSAASLLDGQPHTVTVRFTSDLNSASLSNSPKTISCSPSVSALWIKPSALSWGQANTLTIAGFASGGAGTVSLQWRDVTLNGPWNSVANPAIPSSNDASWSNTIASPNTCHAFQAIAGYSGMSAEKDYDGVALGYCSMKVIWIQPQSTAGFGPPGSLVVAGSANGGPTGSGVAMWWRDVTTQSGWNSDGYSPIPDANGIWYNSIPNVDSTHQYSVYIQYDDANSSVCTYTGSGSISWCQ